MDREIPKSERQAATRKRLIKWGSILAGVIVVIVFLIGFVRKSVNSDDIIIATADKGTIETSVSASGLVVPAFEQIINSPISTRIVEVYHKEGDTLSEGTPLLRLDLQSVETEINKLNDERSMKHYAMEQSKLNDHTYLSNIELQIKVKEMSVNRLEVELANERRLDSLGSGTGDNVRKAQFAFSTGKMELEQLRNQLDNERKVRDAGMKVRQLEMDIFEKNYAERLRTLNDAQIRSPRAATLTYINQEIGRQVGAGERVAVVSDLSNFKVNAEIADGYGDRLGVGSRAIVRIGKTKLEGHVSNMTPLSKNGVISFTVMLDDDHNPRLRSGLKTEVHIMSDIHDDVTRIPNGTYFKGAGTYEMFVQTADDELEKREVKLGDSNFEFVMVESGLKPGDKVVISDMSSYRNNDKLVLK
ncbi:MAG: efflux RND transporter periplasmic adaptor subunit [Muribaculaceae bacterium]|nr:efflux RND transporter periplasmic adaptor subunit [Muribaculaceae bacterium]